MKRRNLTIVALLVIAFILGFQLGHFDLLLQWKGYQPAIQLKNQQPPKDKQNLDFKLFWDTWDLVSREYVDKKALDPQKMFYGAIQGMVAAIGDPYTVFLPPDQQKSTKEELGGSFEGVGIQLGFSKEKRLVVQTPLDGTPASRAGLKPGDIILKIDDKDATNLSLPEAVSLIRGPKGSSVTLQIFREGEDKPQDFVLVRDTIIVKSAEFKLLRSPALKKVAYLKLQRFGERTFTEWSEAVSSALASSPEAVILDVRNNPGGFLDGAVFIASEFIDSGDIVIKENAQGARASFKVNRAGKLTKLELIVLINKGSASAAEIVAGAIQDLKRGKLVGEQSFGKGTIQSSQDLPQGTGIHITTDKWLTPTNRWIHNSGLTPDVKVEDIPDKEGEDKVDEQLNKALELFD